MKIKTITSLLLISCFLMAFPVNADNSEYENISESIEEAPQSVEAEPLYAKGSYYIDKQQMNMSVGETAYITVTADQVTGRIDWSSTGNVYASGYDWLENGQLSIAVYAWASGNGSVTIKPTDLATNDGVVVKNSYTVQVTVSNSSTAAGTGSARVLSNGMCGDDVALIQKKLSELGYYSGTIDGDFGNMTEQAVKDFQLANGQGYADGIVGNWTIGKLFSNQTTGNQESAQVTKPDSTANSQTSASFTEITRVLYKGMTGDDVVLLQKRLSELGYYSGTIDGDFGNMTEQAVNAFQLANGQGFADGIVGNWTIGKLFSGQTTGNQASTQVTKPDSTANSQTTASYTEITRVLYKGMTGDDVVQLQKRLSELGYYSGTIDGDFGNMTEQAVNAFQLENGQGYADGMVGSWTVGKLFSGQTSGNQGSTQVTTSGSTANSQTTASYTEITRVLYKGLNGDDVVQLQKRLSELGYYSGTIDGDFGNMTEQAVNAFQLENGQGYADGMVGSWTVGKLFG